MFNSGLSDAARWYLKADLRTHAEHRGCQWHGGLIAQRSLQDGEQSWFSAHCSKKQLLIL